MKVHTHCLILSLIPRLLIMTLEVMKHERSRRGKPIIHRTPEGEQVRLMPKLSHTNELTQKAHIHNSELCFALQENCYSKHPPHTLCHLRGWYRWWTSEEGKFSPVESASHPITVTLWYVQVQHDIYNLTFFRCKSFFWMSTRLVI